ncbi:MAG: GAF domain-containing protein, partial [Atribacterota bacterium]|nr:GAF domain-containing protein [Atribacterota bacterium]
VPLKADEKIIGVIALQSYDNARLYSEKDIELLEYVSQQLSAAIYKKALQGKITKKEQDIQEAGSDKSKKHLDTDELPLKEPFSSFSKDNNENTKQVNEKQKY